MLPVSIFLIIGYISWTSPVGNLYIIYIISSLIFYIVFALLKNLLMGCLIKENTIIYIPSTPLVTFITLKILTGKKTWPCNIWTIHLIYSRKTKVSKQKIAKRLLVYITKFNKLNYINLALLGCTPINVSKYLDRIPKIKEKLIIRSLNNKETFFFIKF